MKDITFDLSPDHKRAYIYVDGRLTAVLRAEIHNDDKKNLWVTLNRCSEDEQGIERFEHKPLAYMTGYNALRWDLPK